MRRMNSASCGRIIEESPEIFEIGSGYCNREGGSGETV